MILKSEDTLRQRIDKIVLETTLVKKKSIGLLTTIAITKWAPFLLIDFKADVLYFFRITSALISGKVCKEG